MAADYLPILEVVLFFAVAWLAGRFMALIKVSPLLGEICAGVVLGPHVLNIVPYSDVDHDTDEEHHASNIWVLMGQAGVTLMIFESGMHIHFDKVRQVGAKAMVVAVLGTGLPLVAGMLLITAFGYDLYPNGLAAGVALAPTSVGIALKLLSEVKELNSNYGQTIITAAFGDDVLSLVALVIVLNLAEGSITAGSIILPIVFSLLFVTLGVVIGIYVAPKGMHLLRRVPEHQTASHQPRDELHLGVMLGLLCGFGYIGSLIGSHLLGAFVAGMCFTNVPRSMLVWKRQMKRITNWLVRLFFAATVAFSIPIEIMLSIDSFWKGLVIGVVATILTKIASGIHMGPDKWVVGWAMVARGEFAYLVAETATKTKVEGSGDDEYLMNQEVFSIVVWALLLSTIVAPFAFRKVLLRRVSKIAKTRSVRLGPRRSSRRLTASTLQLVDGSPLFGDDDDETRSRRSAGTRGDPVEDDSADMDEDDNADGKVFVIRVEGHHHAGVLHEICDCLHDQGLDVLEAHMQSDGKVDVGLFTVRSRAGEPLDDETAHELEHHIVEAIDDEETQVVFMEKDLPSASMLEIQLMAKHHPGLVHDVWEALHRMDLDIDRCAVQGFHGVDVDTFYVKDVDGGDVARDRQAKVRSRLTALIHEHNVQGEVMVKPCGGETMQMMTWREVSECSFTVDGVLKITIMGQHHRDMLREVNDELTEMRLDVVNMGLERQDTHDVMVVYVSFMAEDVIKVQKKTTSGIFSIKRWRSSKRSPARDEGIRTMTTDVKESPAALETAADSSRLADQPGEDRIRAPRSNTDVGSRKVAGSKSPSRSNSPDLTDLSRADEVVVHAAPDRQLVRAALLRICRKYDAGCRIVVQNADETVTEGDVIRAAAESRGAVSVGGSAGGSGRGTPVNDPGTIDAVRADSNVSDTIFAARKPSCLGHSLPELEVGDEDSPSSGPARTPDNGASRFDLDADVSPDGVVVATRSDSAHSAHSHAQASYNASQHRDLQRFVLQRRLAAQRAGSVDSRTDSPALIDFQKASNIS